MEKRSVQQKKNSVAQNTSSILRCSLLLELKQRFENVSHQWQFGKCRGNICLLHLTLHVRTITYFIKWIAFLKSAYPISLRVKPCHPHRDSRIVTVSDCIIDVNMDCAPNVNIFKELQSVHDTGYFDGQISLEDDWQQVRNTNWSYTTK